MLYTTTTLPGLLVSDALHFKRYSVTLFRRQLISGDDVTPIAKAIIPRNVDVIK